MARVTSILKIIYDNSSYFISKNKPFILEINYKYEPVNTYLLENYTKIESEKSNILFPG